MEDIIRNLRNLLALYRAKARAEEEKRDEADTRRMTWTEAAGKLEDEIAALEKRADEMRAPR